MPEFVRNYFESRFGQDFGQVRIHTDQGATRSAQAASARAFTFGKNVVFGAGEYAPDTAEGKKLLAHELTHVIQQQAGQRDTPVIQRRVIPGPPRLPPLRGLVPGLETLECLRSVIDDMYPYTRRFIRSYCERTGNPVPNNYSDAFGHCWVACAGSRRCGRSVTAILGTMREIWRELDQDPHDSLSQDLNNQGQGRELSEREGTCFELCDRAVREDELDLSAQTLHCLDCSTLEETDQCGPGIEVVPRGHPMRRRGTGWLPPLED